MDELNKIRKRQKEQNGDNTKCSGKKQKKRRLSKGAFFARVLVTLIIVGIISASGIFVWATWGMDYNMFDSISVTDLRLSTMIYYVDDNGSEREFEYLENDEKRIWCDIDEIPKDLQNAFVAIEDQRFYSHHGVDFKRTVGAVLNVALHGKSSYGGSTITQQLIKNVTNDKERSNARKVREMVRAFVLETKMSKRQILEMYMNSIYLGHGTHGVQAAAKTYFNKDVSDLTLTECASIAGITQYPSLYDPIDNPDNNTEKRNLVLDKMYELEYISSDEYLSALDEKLKLDTTYAKSHVSQSYFADYVFDEVVNDLEKELNYTKEYATNLVYNGGLKIISTVDPKIQDIMNKVFENTDKLPKSAGTTLQPQAAMIVSDPKTGEVKGIVGGTGKKTGARVLNRASQTARQPGSTIKPISVYGPALEKNIINLSTLVENSPLKIGDWAPKNSDKTFSGPVTVRRAVAKSLNLPAVRVLEEVGVNESYDYLSKKLHIDTLVSSKKSGGKVYSDKNLPSLALGGLTDGVTVEQMNAAYSSFANGGKYVEPTAYTKVYDFDGNLLLEKEAETNTAFSEATAFLMDELLKGVTASGTAAGTAIADMDVCGKTGSTDANNDRWFVGYTPYYCATVWYGFDTPTRILVYGTNPALTIWRNVMYEVHKGLDGKKFKQPSTVKKEYICSHTGLLASKNCGYGVNEYVNTKFTSSYCNMKHNNQIGTKGTYYSPSKNSEKDKNNKNTSDNEDEKTTNKSNEETKTDTSQPQTPTKSNDSQSSASPGNDDTVIDLDKITR